MKQSPCSLELKFQLEENQRCSVVDGDKWEDGSIVRGKGHARIPFHLGSLGRLLTDKTFEQSPREDFWGKLVSDKTVNAKA